MQNLFPSAIIDEAGKAFEAESACMRVKILKSMLFLAQSVGLNALSYLKKAKTRWRSLCVF